MLRSTRILALASLAAALVLVVNAPETQAQGIRVQIGGFGIHGGGAYRGAYVNRGGHNFYSNQAHVYAARRPVYGAHGYGAYGYGHRVPRIQSYGHYGGHHGYYHDTTHFDYHAPEVYRHGNHYDIQPGHYDLHRSGHYHH